MLRKNKIIVAAVVVVAVLLFLTPLLMSAVPSSTAGGFSQIWVLGSEQTTSDYPFNVTAGGNYTVYLGVGNHLGVTGYYAVEIKLRNEGDSLPDQTLGTPSSLPSLCEEQLVLANGETWQQQLNFSFSNVQFSGNTCTVGTLNIGNESVLVNKAASWDSVHKGFYYQLVFELWLFNLQTQSFQFNSRYCGVWLNMTSTAAS